jgi:hypothetical protein
MDNRYRIQFVVATIGGRFKRALQCLANSVFFVVTAPFSHLHAIMSGGPSSSSWANIASTAPRPKTASVIEPERILQRVGVIDANAIITHQSGLLNLHTQYDRIVTIPEVIAEVRDGQSRQALSTLPFEIEQLTPSEESMRAVGAFARETVRDMKDDARRTLDDECRTMSDVGRTCERGANGLSRRLLSFLSPSLDLSPFILPSIRRSIDRETCTR